MKRFANCPFDELYNKRWGIETKYLELKQRLELENFSGRLVDMVKQDFFTLMMVANMVASMVREANRKARKKGEGNGNKYEHQVNVNHTIGVYKELSDTSGDRRRGDSAAVFDEGDAAFDGKAGSADTSGSGDGAQKPRAG